MTISTTSHFLDCDEIHRVWDHAIPPRLEIDSGDSVTFRTRNVGDGSLTPESTAEDVRNRKFIGHPLTGPVSVKEARVGDVLQIEILELQPDDWGLTLIAPGRGLLPEDFSDPYLKIWDLSDGDSAELRPGIRVPLEPFHGVMGLAPAEPGQHSTMPPRRMGGNMDIKQLTVGSTLWLPIEVDGGLFSCGDGHAAQGDGEVCITAIETAMTSTLRFTLRRDFTLNGPEFQVGGQLTPRTNTAGWYATTGVAPDLMDATKAAVRGMIAYLVRTRDLTREEAYVLSSVAVDLKISEVVDAPNWIVSAFLPLSIFGD